MVDKWIYDDGHICFRNVASVYDRKSYGVDVMEITKETRLEGYLSRPVKRCSEILKFMGDRELTARQIAYGLGYRDLNAAKPRLSEMKEAGVIEVVGKTQDSVTKRNVAVYRAAGKEEK